MPIGMSRRDAIRLGCMATALYFPRKSKAWTHGSAFNIPGLPVWSSAVRAMQAGSANAIVLLLGDSTTVSFGANGNGYNGAQPLSYPADLQGLLNAAGLSSLNKHFWNQGNVDSLSPFPSYDTRVTYGSGWGGNGTERAFGGTNIVNSTTTNPLSFAPGVSFDTIDVYYATGAGLGTFTVDIGGASLGTLNCAGTAGYAKQTFTVSAGINTVNIKRVSGNVVFCAINCYTAAQKSIHIIAAGNNGALSDWIANGSTGTDSAAANLGIVAPHLTVLCCTINDWNNAFNLTTFQNNTQAIINAAKVYGDVILMTGVPTSTATTAQATQDSYTAVYSSLASSNSLKLIDMKAQWGSFAAANALGLYFDNIHPSGLGYGGGTGGLLGVSKLVYNAMTGP